MIWFKKLIIINLILSCSELSEEQEYSISAEEKIFDVIDITTLSPDNNKKTIAILETDSTKTQVLKASNASKLVGTEVFFPPGCISSNSSDMDLSLEEGVENYFNIGVSDFNELSSDKILNHEPTVLLRSSNTKFDFLCEFLKIFQ